MTTDRETLLWLVFTRPVAGMEDEFDTWYDDVHLPDVAAVPGVRAAQRFTLGPERRDTSVEPEFRHLTVYEIDGDPDEVFPEITRRIESGDIVLAEALDRPKTWQSVWHPHGPRLTAAEHVPADAARND
jgi:hypothetical protein